MDSRAERRRVERAERKADKASAPHGVAGKPKAMNRAERRRSEKIFRRIVTKAVAAKAAVPPLPAPKKQGTVED